MLGRAEANGHGWVGGRRDACTQQPAKRGFFLRYPPQEGIVAILTSSPTDVLSHIAIRARAQGVLLATCFDAAGGWGGRARISLRWCTAVVFVKSMLHAREHQQQCRWGVLQQTLFPMPVGPCTAVVCQRSTAPALPPHSSLPLSSSPAPSCRAGRH